MRPWWTVRRHGVFDFKAFNDRSSIISITFDWVFRRNRSLSWVFFWCTAWAWCWFCSLIERTSHVKQMKVRVWNAGPRWKLTRINLHMVTLSKQQSKTDFWSDKNLGISFTVREKALLLVQECRVICFISTHHVIGLLNPHRITVLIDISYANFVKYPLLPSQLLPNYTELVLCSEISNAALGIFRTVMRALTNRCWVR